MARRLNVLSRSYKTITYLPSADTARDATGDYPTIIVTSWREIMFLGRLLKIPRSPGEIGRRKGLKIPRL
jgi:hypothetical protein